MINLIDRVIATKVINTTNNLSVQYNALIDTGASTSCIPKQVIKQLDLRPIGVVKVSTVAGQQDVMQYLIDIEIKDKLYRATVVGIDSLDFALIGWDILSKNKIFPNLIEANFEQTLSFLSVIPELKKNVVLILGQDTTEIKRLHLIRHALKQFGYEGIIAKDLLTLKFNQWKKK